MLKSFRFNPGFQTDDQSVHGFVVRHEEFQTILDGLSSEDFARQHILIIAQRGAGKTTLCRRVLAEIRRQPDLAEKWIPVFLGEESYAATTPAEFLQECLYHLANDLGHTDAITAHAEALQIQDDSELLAYCLSALKRLSASNDKRFLLFVENLHMMLNDQMGDRKEALATLLSDEPLFGVLATSVKSHEESEAFDVLGRFSKIRLDPLNLDECHELWEALTALQVDRARIRPLQILTGGSPRLIQILAEFTTSRSLRYLMENLNGLIDQNTEYFKSQLDALPAQERKVFVALLEVWNPASAKQISEIARVSVNTASSMLNRLAERGAVVKAPGIGRSAIYYVAERLFNIYYLMRRRSHPSNRVRALVSFMTQYYAPDELVASTTDLAIEACGVEPAGRADYHSAFDAILKGQPEAIRAEILKRTPPDFLASLRSDPAVKNYSAPVHTAVGPVDQFSEILSQARTSIDEKRYSEGRSLLLEAMEIKPESYEPWLSLAFLELHEDATEAAVEAAKAGVEKAKENPVAFTVLGIMLNANHEHDAAEVAFTHALELDPQIQLALIELAKINSENENDDKALDLFEKAAELGSLPDEDLTSYARLLSRNDGKVEAERLLRNAVASSPSFAMSRHMLVHLLIDSDREVEGGEILRNAAESSVESSDWTSYASYCLMVLDDPGGSLKAATSALERGVSSARLYKIWADAAVQLDHPYDEIIQIAERMLHDMAPTLFVHIVAGQIYETVEAFDAAEVQYRLAGLLDDADEYPWLLLGRMLSKLPTRMDDAEAAFRQAVELEASDSGCAALKDLAELRVHKGDDVDAAALLDAAIARNDECICSLILRAEIAVRNNMRELAIEHLEAALQLNPANVAALTALARISPAADAEKLIERAVEAAPDDPRTLLARSRLTTRDLASRLQDARDAVVDAPEFTEAKLELAILSAEQGDREHALDQLKDALDAIPAQMEIIPSFVSSAIKLVRLGYVDEVEKILTGEAGAAVEPLLIALQLYKGEKPIVAKEVEDVASDILKQIETE